MITMQYLEIKIHFIVSIYLYISVDIHLSVYTTLLNNSINGEYNIMFIDKMILYGKYIHSHQINLCTGCNCNQNFNGFFN